MSITAPLDKRTPASTLFATYTLVIALLGAALIYLGGTSVAAGARDYFVPISGVALLVAGVQLFRRRRVGLWLFALALLGTLVWGVLATMRPVVDTAQPAIAFLPAALQGLALPTLLMGVMAALGFIMLAFWPVARRRLTGVARPGYFIINGVLPLALLITIAITQV